MSITQPSANQVANIYQGNPGALNARIQQEQKSKPAGMPPDLAKLMALNIDTNEQDAAKRQQAMAALQSMQQQGGGEPPTVAQTIQQQAMQKAQLMQQQMQQQQPKPQGLMALLQARGMPQHPRVHPVQTVSLLALMSCNPTLAKTLMVVGLLRLTEVVKLRKKAYLKKMPKPHWFVC